MKEIKPELSYIVETARVPASGVNVDIAADEKQRKALAGRFGINGINSLTAHIVLKRINGTQIRVHGDFEASVVQTCVVSLEPFEETVRDNFTVVFSQEEGTSLKVNEIDLDMSQEDDVEPVENGRIDVGELTAEYLSLALDPFPHAPDAVFDARPVREKEENPFSVLEKLKFK